MPMSHDARAIANVVLDHADALGISISHLSLQKVLFFLHGWRLRQTRRPLIRQAIEAWTYGPVIRVVYDEFKDTSDGQQLTARAKQFDLVKRKRKIAVSNFTKEEIDFIHEWTGYYARINAFDLMKMTHVDGGSWEKVFNEKVFSPGNIINNHWIQEHFDNLGSFQRPS